MTMVPTDSFGMTSGNASSVLGDIRKADGDDSPEALLKGSPGDFFSNLISNVSGKASQGAQSGFDLLEKIGSYSPYDPDDPDSVLKYASMISESNPAMAEILLNYALSEKSNIAAYNREMESSSTTYQRMVTDLQKAGLNPMLAIGGLSGSHATSNGKAEIVGQLAKEL